MKLLTDTEIGDALDLDKEHSFKCSEGSIVTTVDVRPVVSKQFQADCKDEADWLEKLCYSHGDEHVAILKNLEKHIAELRRQAEVK